MAKLLSRNEQSDRLENSVSTQGNSPIKILCSASVTLLFVLLFASLIGLPASSQGGQVEHRSMHLRHFHLETRFVRPPPSLI